MTEIQKGYEKILNTLIARMSAARDKCKTKEGAAILTEIIEWYENQKKLLG